MHASFYQNIKKGCLRMPDLKNKLFTIFCCITILLHNSTIKVESSHNFTLISAQDLIKRYPNITYQKCFDALPFEYKPFPLSINPSGHPCSGIFLESFVLTVPNGKVQSENGWTPIDHYYVKELLWKNQEWHLQFVKPINKSSIQKIHGRVAVINQPCYFQYFHWTTEVLCRLALLELCNIEYDYLYVTNHSSFMKETLELWGIPTEKIISPKDDNFCIQADHLIIPSLASTSSLGMPLFSSYAQPHLLKYVKNKLLSKALLQKPTIELHDKVFISRKDAPQRKILNEDAVFKVFEAIGFKRYSLTGMPVADQIQLFYNAQIIVGPQGTSIANCIFCTPKTRIIELFQGLNDATFWYIAQILPLNYTPIKTTTFITDYSAAWSSDTIMPLPIIKELAKSL